MWRKRKNNEEIYWEIESVSLEKDERIITYYINLCVSTLVDLVYQEPGEYPYPAGKEALDINGKLVIKKEEYATSSNIVSLEITLNEMRHIEPKIYNIIKNANEGMTCKQIIKANDVLEQYNKIKELRNIKVHIDEEEIKKLKESLIKYTVMQKYKEAFHDSSDITRLQKYYCCLNKVALDDMDDGDTELY